MANVSKLLHTTTDPEHFLANLDVDPAPLLAARKKIRERLRHDFAQGSEVLFERVVQPRFFTQGSFAYKTLNEPVWAPRQQKDLDDGCYLPLSFVHGERPSKAAKLFFDFVDKSLSRLASEEGWSHKTKPTCVRLVISPDAHVDVPLYAIPDLEFALLEARVVAKRMTVASAKFDSWTDLPHDSVLLAHREKDWVESDPRKIHRWFVEAVDGPFGERLRRDSRYLKAWRDYHRLDDQNLTSIMLMASAWKAYDIIRLPFLSGREDERLLQVVERLPGLLSGEIKIPPCGAEDLNRMNVDQQRVVVREAENLRERLKSVISACSQEKEAVDLMQAILGDRVPDRPDLVTISAPAAAAVLSQPKRVVPAPVVGRSESG